MGDNHEGNIDIRLISHDPFDASHNLFFDHESASIYINEFVFLSDNVSTTCLPMCVYVV
jgi:hypothetical protein